LPGAALIDQQLAPAGHEVTVDLFQVTIEKARGCQAGADGFLVRSNANQIVSDFGAGQRVIEEVRVEDRFENRGFDPAPTNGFPWRQMAPPSLWRSTIRINATWKIRMRGTGGWVDLARRAARAKMAA
jgi:hypothetical protein